MDDLLEFLFGMLVFGLWGVGALIKFLASRASAKRQQPRDEWANWDNEAWAQPSPVPAAPAPAAEPKVAKPPAPPAPNQTAASLSELQARAVAHLEAAAQQHQANAAPGAVWADVHESQDLQIAADETERALADAFPKAMHLVRDQQQRGGARRIVVSKHGLRSLRRAMIMNEVLNRPRAFDL